MVAINLVLLKRAMVISQDYHLQRPGQSGLKMERKMYVHLLKQSAPQISLLKRTIIIGINF